MSKAILFMDMPESCCYCRMARLVGKDEVMCSIDRMSKRNYEDATKDRPDWCPLVPMPEKKPYVGTDAINSNFLSGRVNEALHEAAWLGWNACIGALGGGNHEQI